MRRRYSENYFGNFDTLSWKNKRERHIARNRCTGVWKVKNAPLDGVTSGEAIRIRSEVGLVEKKGGGTYLHS